MVKNVDTVRNQGANLPKLIGLLCALMALAACVIQKTDPANSFLRALVAFVVGSALTKAWYALLAARIAPTESSLKDEDTKDIAA
ncbi:MAG: hypothetical protein U0R49_06940 [Fimbriimonadales bacterium]